MRKLRDTYSAQVQLKMGLGYLQTSAVREGVDLPEMGHRAAVWKGLWQKCDRSLVYSWASVRATPEGTRAYTAQSSLPLFSCWCCITQDNQRPEGKVAGWWSAHRSTSWGTVQRRGVERENEGQRESPTPFHISEPLDSITYSNV